MAGRTRGWVGTRVHIETDNIESHHPEAFHTVAQSTATDPIELSREALRLYHVIEGLCRGSLREFVAQAALTDAELSPLFLAIQRNPSFHGLFHDKITIEYGAQQDGAEVVWVNFKESTRNGGEFGQVLSEAFKTAFQALADDRNSSEKTCEAAHQIKVDTLPWVWLDRDGHDGEETDGSKIDSNETDSDESMACKYPDVTFEFVEKLHDAPLIIEIGFHRRAEILEAEVEEYFRYSDVLTVLTVDLPLANLSRQHRGQILHDVSYSIDRARKKNGEAVWTTSRKFFQITNGRVEDGALKLMLSDLCPEHTFDHANREFA